MNVFHYFLLVADLDALNEEGDEGDGAVKR